MPVLHRAAPGWARLCRRLRRRAGGVLVVTLLLALIACSQATTVQPPTLVAASPVVVASPFLAASPATPPTSTATATVAATATPFPTATAIATPTPTPTMTPTSTPLPTATPTVPPTPTALPTLPPAPTATPTPLPTPLQRAPAGGVARPVAGGRITAVGDSIMLGSADLLRGYLGTGLDLDAVVGRQPAEALEVLRARHDAGVLGQVVIVHIGTNGPFTQDQFDAMMALLSGVRLIEFVNVRVPRDWEGPNNALLAAAQRRYPNIVLADWYATSAGHPEYFRDDGYHLVPAGQQAYTTLIVARLYGLAAPGDGAGAGQVAQSPPAAPLPCAPRDDLGELLPVHDRRSCITIPAPGFTAGRAPA